MPAPSSSNGTLQDLALRRRFLMTIMAASLLWAGGMIFSSFAGWLSLGRVQEGNTFAFLLLVAVLLFAVRCWPGRFTPIAAFFFLAAFCYIGAAQFLVPRDSLRMLLFFPCVGAIFLIFGGIAAWIAIAAALAIFAVAAVTNHVVVTPLAASTFAITLGFTGVCFHVFSVQARRALATVYQQNAALDVAARQDTLTGLLNLRAFREAMNGHFAGARAGDPFALAFVDVDEFKSINDRYGHAGGDTILIAVAHTLKAAVRGADVVARIGGEEFAILMPRTELPDALGVAERVRTEIQDQAFAGAAEALTVTVSVGVTVSRAPRCTVDAMLQAADMAMYAAKAEGRNRVVAAPKGAAGLS
ncbi:GGDEF domain-containing protein [Xanthobacter sp. VTT E-85241]|uniref:GGDEF domain-containing protein n=1 Tax=Roseixanthobacter finlandensis TaxID=3119922 RepID=UPI00372A7D61